MDQNNKHQPVLVAEVLNYLDPQPGESYLDLTAGYGGHARVVLQRTKNGRTVLIDRDEQAIEHLTQHFSGKNIIVRHQDFLAASQELLGEKAQFDLILADLGISSPHLNIASRGFSIKNDGPLDMRMDQHQNLTAETIVNIYSEKQLSDVLLRYGEEPKAHRIASAIVHHRPITTTNQLAQIVAEAIRHRGKIHPATKTFQALRIAVNDELEQIEKALPLWIDLLAPGGRIAIISFHSLEDRLVKQALKEACGGGYDARLILLSKKAISGTRHELAINPRARSAKLRAAVKIKIFPPKISKRNLGG